MKDKKEIQDDAKEILAQKSFENIMRSQVSVYGKILMKPLAINSADSELFSYRISNLLSSLSPYHVKLAQLIENKKIILKSSKMRKYFNSHKNERILLLEKLSKLCKKFHKYIVKIPEKVPDYLKPSFLQNNERSRGRLNIFKKRMKKRQKMEEERQQKEAKVASVKTKKIRKKKRDGEFPAGQIKDIDDDSANVVSLKKPKNPRINQDLYEEENFDLEGLEFDEDKVDIIKEETSGVDMIDEEFEDLEDPSSEDIITVNPNIQKKIADITAKDWKNLEHPILRDARTLPTLSSRKLWQQKHGIRKKVNRKNLRKGLYKL